MMLSISGLKAFYGKSQVLWGVDVDVDAGEVVAVLGRNGAGKTTTLKSLMSLVERRYGSITFEGTSTIDQEPYEIARLGIGYVPENRGVFTKLTVEQNLKIAQTSSQSLPLDDIYQQFPRLRERRGNWGYQLSGGEQQMVAIARALIASPKLILLDEPSQGLAPVIVQDVVKVIKRLQDAGVAVLIVEQNLDVCMAVAQRVYVIDNGRTVYTGTRDQFSDTDDIRARYLTLEGAESHRSTEAASHRGHQGAATPMEETRERSAP